MNVRWHIPAVLWMSLLFCGCDLINPEEQVPAYIYVQPFSYSPAQGDESQSFRITEAWIYVGGELLGAFHLPAIVPVLAEGNQTMTFFPGILDNGLVSYPNIYHFYQPFEIQMDLKPAVTDTVYPATHYADYVKFAYINDFELGFLFDEDLDSDPTTVISSTDQPDDVFEGDYAGISQLDSDHKQLHVTTSQFFDIPVNGTPVYFEMNYRSDVELTIGLEGKELVSGQTASVYPVRLFSKTDWNKIYINLTEEVQNSDLDVYRVTLFASLPDSMTSARISFDNLKLVHQ